MTHALTAEEADEIRALLDAFPAARRAAQLMTRARLRRTNIAVLAEAPEPSRIEFEQLRADGRVVVDPTIPRARITPHSSTQQIFRVAVGVTGRPVDAGWNAFDQRYQWFGKAPKQVPSGAHLFVLAVDR